MLPADHLKSFQSKIKRSRRLLARQIEFWRNGQLPITELEAIYELSFLNAFVAFESELTELLKTNMLMDRGSDGKIRSIFSPANRSLAGQMLNGPNRYFQLLPVEQMERISRIYLKGGGPFIELSGPQKKAIGQSYAIRNHIAHRSPDSKLSYSKKVLANVILPRSSFSPGYYLRNNQTANITYFDFHVSSIGGCLRTIAEKS